MYTIRARKTSETSNEQNHTQIKGLGPNIYEQKYFISYKLKCLNFVSSQNI